jgi:hypothetical protein
MSGLDADGCVEVLNCALIFMPASIRFAAVVESGRQLRRRVSMRVNDRRTALDDDIRIAAQAIRPVCVMLTAKRVSPTGTLRPFRRYDNCRCQSHKHEETNPGASSDLYVPSSSHWKILQLCRIIVLLSS